jgi:hypothetical protein
MMAVFTSPRKNAPPSFAQKVDDVKQAFELARRNSGYRKIEFYDLHSDLIMVYEKKNLGNYFFWSKTK